MGVNQNQHPIHAHRVQTHRIPASSGAIAMPSLGPPCSRRQSHPATQANLTRLCFCSLMTATFLHRTKTTLRAAQQHRAND